MADIVKKIIAELWLMFIEGKQMTPKQVAVLYGDARNELLGLENRAKIVRTRLKMLQVACKHPRKGSAHVCPDCGFDSE